MASHRMINPPIKIYFDGFDSDTYRLGRSGWEVHATQDDYLRHIGFMLIHKKTGLYLETSKVRADLQAMAYDPQSLNLFIQKCEFRPTAMDRSTRIEFRGGNPYESYQHVDHIPQMVEFEFKSIEDFFLFQPKARKEIIVDPVDVAEMMKLILKKQNPKMQEIREKERKRTRREIGDMTQPKIVSHAEILSVSTED